MSFLLLVERAARHQLKEQDFEQRRLGYRYRVQPPKGKEDPAYVKTLQEALYAQRKKWKPLRGGQIIDLHKDN